MWPRGSCEYYNTSHRVCHGEMGSLPGLSCRQLLSVTQSLLDGHTRCTYHDGMGSPFLVPVAYRQPLKSCIDSYQFMLTIVSRARRSARDYVNYLSVCQF